MKTFSLLLLALLFLSGCSSSVRFSSSRTGGTQSGQGGKAIPGEKMTGIASYYHDKFDGRTTSNGETFSQNELTAAHRTLPFGTMLEVRNVKNNRRVIVRVNDRGPFVGDRIIDLSRRAAEELDMVRYGTAEVEITVL